MRITDLAFVDHVLIPDNAHEYVKVLAIKPEWSAVMGPAGVVVTRPGIGRWTYPYHLIKRIKESYEPGEWEEPKRKPSIAKAEA